MQSWELTEEVRERAGGFLALGANEVEQKQGRAQLRLAGAALGGFAVYWCFLTKSCHVELARSAWV